LSPRQIILFLLIVLTPLGVAGWLGLEVARDEQAVGQHQFQSLLQDRLRDVDSAIAATIQGVERSLLDEVLSSERTGISDPGKELDPAATDTLRALRRKEPFVRQVFVADDRGRLVFPPDDDTASADERGFRTRTRSIWQGSAVLYAPPGQGPGPGQEGSGEVRPEKEHGQERGQEHGQDHVQTLAQATLADAGATRRPEQPRSSQGDTLVGLAEDHDHGWISWYWEEGLHLLFWRRMGRGVVGVEVERVALIAHIVGKLPATQPEDGRVVLVSSRGAPVHQWGPYEPASGDAPLATAPVRYPLDAWRLHHYVSPAQKQAFFGDTLRANLITGLSAVALALLAMAFLFYRDYAGKMRDAAQRVSFVTRVSHELKTPLTNIRLYAELIDTDLLDSELLGDDDRIQRRLSVIIAESQRLTRLINNILAFSKQRQSQLKVHKTWIELHEVVDAVLDQFAPALAAKGITCSVKRGATRPVHADADAVGQIVANLVSNVEKYAAGGGALEVETRQQGARTVVRVADRGPGIDAAHRDAIFRPFYRVSDQLADGVTGTGIGLSIARELARMSGGDLVLAPSDAGACFELWLPTSEPSANEIAASEIAASEITASEMTASEITTSEITTSEIAASEMTASEENSDESARG
jgi:signal transduction histidine kinase